MNNSYYMAIVLFAFVSAISFMNESSYWADTHKGGNSLMLILGWSFAGLAIITFILGKIENNKK